MDNRRTENEIHLSSQLPDWTHEQDTRGVWHSNPPQRAQVSEFGRAFIIAFLVFTAAALLFALMHQ